MVPGFLAGFLVLRTTKANQRRLDRKQEVSGVAFLWASPPIREFYRLKLDFENMQHQSVSAFRSVLVPSVPSDPITRSVGHSGGLTGSTGPRMDAFLLDVCCS